MVAYTKFSADPSNPDGTWAKVTTQSGNLQELMEKARNMTVDYENLPFSYTLAEAPVTVNGRECYQLNAVMTLDELMLIVQPYLNDIGDTAGVSGDELFAYSSLLSGLQFTYEVYIDTTTFQMIRFRMTTDGTDWSSIGANLSSLLSTGEDENQATVNLDVRQFEVTGDYNPDASVSIVVPEEALNAQELQENDLSDSLLDLVENAE